MTSSAGRASDYYTGDRRADYLGLVVEPASVRWTAMNLPYFQRYVRSTDTVLDFGCSVGRLLLSLRAGTRMGVEVNDVASAQAQSAGIEIFRSSREVPSDVVDVVVSHHAIEHVLSPFDELVELRRVLRSGGRFVTMVPLENWRTNVFPKPSDPDNHLFAWTPLTFSNLLREAGFRVIKAETITRAPLPQSVRRHREVLGRYWSRTRADHLYGAVRGLRQVYLVAENPG